VTHWQRQSERRVAAEDQAAAEVWTGPLSLFPSRRVPSRPSLPFLSSSSFSISPLSGHLRQRQQHTPAATAAQADKRKRARAGEDRSKKIKKRFNHNELGNALHGE